MTALPLDPDPNDPDVDPDGNPIATPPQDPPARERPDLDPIQPGAPH